MPTKTGPMGSGLAFCLYTHTNAIYTNALDWIAGNPVLFLNKQGTAKSHSEDRRYLCRFHLCNEILMRLHEIFKTGKKQDLIPLTKGVDFFIFK